MTATISEGTNHITTKGHAFGMFQHKHQYINALKAHQKSRPFGMLFMIYSINIHYLNLVVFLN